MGIDLEVHDLLSCVAVCCSVCVAVEVPDLLSHLDPSG